MRLSTVYCFPENPLGVWLILNLPIVTIKLWTIIIGLMVKDKTVAVHIQYLHKKNSLHHQRVQPLWDHTSYQLVSLLPTCTYTVSEHVQQVWLLQIL